MRTRFAHENRGHFHDFVPNVTWASGLRKASAGRPFTGHARERDCGPPSWTSVRWFRAAGLDCVEPAKDEPCDTTPAELTARFGLHGLLQHPGMILGFGKGRGGWVWRAAAEFGRAGRDRDRVGALLSLARRIGRAPSTVSREGPVICPSSGTAGAFPAHIQTTARARRDLPRKLVASTSLRAEVAKLLRPDYSPGQIAGRLGRNCPHRPDLQSDPRDDLAGAVRAGQVGSHAEVATALRRRAEPGGVFPPA